MDPVASGWVGKRIGTYEVLGLLGAGAMGEVYRARDSRLGRDVALKILPDLFCADPERLARFEREAKVLASLSHPNIAAIFGIEDQPDPAAGPRVHALVLELVEGETLADRLTRAAAERRVGLPVADVLSIARQLANALDAAHEQGIVHRDLKPANIKIRPDGLIKVLDFGLARVGAGGAALADAAWTRATATVDGSLLGSPAYMSPEQARGGPIDKRTDIWAFGCVLFELLTGRLAFKGETVTDTLVQIFERDPDWSALPAETPRGVRKLLERCLARDRRARLRDIADADFGDGADSTSPGPVLQPQFQRLTDSVGINESPAISPDGKMVVFVAPADGRRHIWVQLLAGGTPLRITRDAVDHEQPRWAPDSSTLIYFTPPSKAGDEGTVWEISALGGAPRPLFAALNAADINHAGDRIAAFQSRTGRVALVTAARDGSRAEPIAVVSEFHAQRSVRWSPDDRWLAFEAAALSQFDERLYVLPAAGGELRSIARAGSIRGVAWLPDTSGLIYSSSTGSTVPYPPTLNLWRVSP
ncbi:MAG: protein kinase domain-containing protein, partial [Acidobacteriota bacterium]